MMLLVSHLLSGEGIESNRIESSAVEVLLFFGGHLRASINEGRIESRIEW